jgi:hypothetical protein
MGWEETVRRAEPVSDPLTGSEKLGKEEEGRREIGRIKKERRKGLVAPAAKEIGFVSGEALAAINAEAERGRRQQDQ